MLVLHIFSYISFFTAVSFILLHYIVTDIQWCKLVKNTPGHAVMMLENKAFGIEAVFECTRWYINIGMRSWLGLYTAAATAIFPYFKGQEFYGILRVNYFQHLKG